MGPLRLSRRSSRSIATRSSSSTARRGRAAVHRLRRPAVPDRLYGQAVQAYGEADRPRAVRRARYSDSSTTSERQRLILAVRLVRDRVEELALLLIHEFAVLRRARNEHVVGDHDGSVVQPATVQDALQVGQVGALVV